MAKGGFRNLARASGSVVGKMAIITFSCKGCGIQYKGKCPTQCQSCGRMDFIRFDSNSEAKRWAQLLLLERAGIVRNLHRQFKFSLYAHRVDGVGVKVGDYIADFIYEEFISDEWDQVIEDFKGAITDIAHWKLRHMEAQGMKVKISTAKGF